MPTRRPLRALLLLAGLTTAGLTALGLGLTLSDDPVSAALRPHVEHAVNGWVRGMAERAQDDALTGVDRAALRAGTTAGLGVGYVLYPDAVAILRHYLYGDGTPLQLPAERLRDSPHIQASVARLGEGTHGPIALRQSEDWALSLALNPYHLEVTADRVRVFHPRIAFAEPTERLVHTDVPLGKLTLRVYDNLVPALGATPFEVYAEWPRDGADAP